MNAIRISTNRPALSTALGQTMLKPLFAIALAIAVAAPMAANAADDDAGPLGAERGISVVPVETPAATDEANEAAEIADLADIAAGQGEEPEITPLDEELDKVTILDTELDKQDAAAPVAEEPVVEVEEAAPAFADVHSAADAYEQLINGGYDVTVLHHDQLGRYVFLVKTDAAPRDLVLLIDGDTGEVLAHELVDPRAHPQAHPQARPQVAPEYTYTARPAYGRNCHGGNAGYAGYTGGYRAAATWGRY